MIRTYGVGFVAGLEPGPPNELMVEMAEMYNYAVTTRFAIHSLIYL